MVALGDAEILAHPPLQVLTGWTAVLSGDVVTAERWAAAAESATFEGPPGDGSASFASARAMLRAVMCADGPERMLADAEFALAAEPSWSPWRDVALYVAGDAQVILGRPDMAAEHFLAVTTRPTDSRNIGARVLSHTQLAMIHLSRGRPAEAADLLETAQ